MIRTLTDNPKVGKGFRVLCDLITFDQKDILKSIYMSNQITRQTFIIVNDIDDDSNKDIKRHIITRLDIAAHTSARPEVCSTRPRVQTASSWWQSPFLILRGTRSPSCHPETDSHGRPGQETQERDPAPSSFSWTPWILPPAPGRAAGRGWPVSCCQWSQYSKHHKLLSHSQAVSNKSNHLVITFLMFSSFSKLTYAFNTSELISSKHLLWCSRSIL